jgi:hypothetical protein
VHILEKHLRDIREAYALGRLKPAIEVSNRNLPAEQEKELYTPVSSAEQALLSQCSHYRMLALQAARRGEYALTHTLLSAAEQYMQGSQLSPAGYFVVQSAHEAAAAYLDYREENFESGITRIHRALTFDEQLEETYGFVYFHAHRIRLLLNLVRLKRRQGERLTALNMSFALMDYLEQKAVLLPFPTSWDIRRLKYLSSDQRTFFFEQALFEVIFLVAGQFHLSEDFLSAFTEHTHSKSGACCQLSPRSHLWLQARQALQAEDPDLFLELVTPLIAAGPGDVIWLWYGILIDLVMVCKPLDLEQAHLLLQDVAGDMASWRWSGLPPAWKQDFQQMTVQMSI